MSLSGQQLRLGGCFSFASYSSYYSNPEAALESAGEYAPLEKLAPAQASLAIVWVISPRILEDE